jgi:alkyl hydroperoxide reductase subunit AhpF
MTVIGEREAHAIGELFAGLDRDVELRLELGPATERVTVITGSRELDFGDEARKLSEAVSGLSERVRLEVVEREEPGRYPSLTIKPGELRYYGLPWGYELSTLVYAIAEAGKGQPSLSEASRSALATLERDVAIDVYVTPT